MQVNFSIACLRSLPKMQTWTFLRDRQALLPTSTARPLTAILKLSLDFLSRVFELRRRSFLLPAIFAIRHQLTEFTETSRSSPHSLDEVELPGARTSTTPLHAVEFAPQNGPAVKHGPHSTARATAQSSLSQAPYSSVAVTGSRCGSSPAQLAKRLWDSNFRNYILITIPQRPHTSRRDSFSRHAIARV